MTKRTYTLFLAIVSSTLLCFPSAGLGQSLKMWSETPVFDGGRVMPLYSFARQIVKDICGTSDPYLVPDDSIIQELNRVVESQPRSDAAQDTAYTLPPNRRDELLGGLDVGLGIVTDELRRHQEETVLKIKGMDRSRAEYIIQRINALVPPDGRYFDATELLLSWFGEPEVWEYIPIFAASESDYRNDVLEIPYKNKTRTTLRRVAVFQLNQSAVYQRRLADLARKQAEATEFDIPSRFDRITERIARAQTAFQDLIFDPSRHRPSRMIELLHRTGDLSGMRESSYASAIETWSHLLALGDDPERTKKQTSLDEDARMHPTTERWHMISRKIIQLSGAFDRSDTEDRPIIPDFAALERQFELLLQTIDQNLVESAALMERVYPGVAFQVRGEEESKRPQVETFLPKLFSPENTASNKDAIMQLALNYHYAVKSLHREVEAAYLALYDNGRTLRLLPLISELPFTSSGVQPWASMRLLMNGKDAAIRRFLAPDFPAPAVKSAGDVKQAKQSSKSDAPAEKGEAVIPGILTSTMSRDSGKDDEELKRENSVEEPQPTEEASEEAKGPIDERFEIELFGNDITGPAAMAASSSSSYMKDPPPSDLIRWIRVSFDRLFNVYVAPGREDSYENFNENATRFHQNLRSVAQRVETEREKLADTDHHIVRETLQKTAYPPSGAVNTEYRYFRLAPFFWMWLFAAAAAAFVLISILTGIFRREMIDSPFTLNQQNSRTPSRRRIDFTNSAEEYTLWIGVALLGASIFVTLIGGMMRAWISGWAPVTNMYESVVLMAFSAALFGLWYSLYPLIHPALQLAWDCTSFPAWSLLASVFQSKTAEPIPDDNDGRYAMRQAAQDFGVPGSMDGSGIYAGQLVDSYDDDPREKENKRQSGHLAWQTMMTVPRLILTVLTFFLAVRLSYGEWTHDQGVFEAAIQMLQGQDGIDILVVLLSIALVVWFVPHLMLTLALFPFFLARPGRIAAELGIVSTVQQEDVPAGPERSEMSSVFHGETAAAGLVVDNSGSVWLKRARNQILDRKPFLVVAATVTLIAGVIAQYNSTEFNPNIRPLAAVLRSNFWLTIHVTAIIVGYAAALVAWGMAVVMSGVLIFGRYRHLRTEDGRSSVRLPSFCERFMPGLLKLIRLALLLLALGTVLGARWADYSWGRFWSWDPKEVWALITILFFTLVLHGRLARYYKEIGVILGALGGSVAVIMTWYAINFVLKGSMHSYGGGAASNATLFLLTFVALNLLWGFLVLFRSSAESYGNDAG